MKPINRLGWVPKESIGSQHFINGRCRARKEIKTNLMHKYNTGGKRGILGFLMYVQDDDLAGSDNINISAYKHTRRERERERDRDVRSPQSQIVSEKLHDQGTVLV